jgi:hypothetical protein
LLQQLDLAELDDWIEVGIVFDVSLKPFGMGRKDLKKGLDGIEAELAYDGESRRGIGSRSAETVLDRNAPQGRTELFDGQGHVGLQVIVQVEMPSLLEGVQNADVDQDVSFPVL